MTPINTASLLRESFSWSYLDKPAAPSSGYAGTSTPGHDRRVRTGTTLPTREVCYFKTVQVALEAAFLFAASMLVPVVVLALLLGASVAQAQSTTQGCPAQTVTWAGQGITCAAAITAGRSGAALGVVSTNGEQGSAWLSCEGGRWVAQGGFCASSKPPAPVTEVRETPLFATYSCSGAQAGAGCASLEVMCSTEQPRVGAYPVLVQIAGVPSTPGSALTPAHMRSAMLACYRAVNGFEADWDGLTEELVRGSLGIQANAQRVPNASGVQANRWEWVRGMN